MVCLKQVKFETMKVWMKCVDCLVRLVLWFRRTSSLEIITRLGITCWDTKAKSHSGFVRIVISIVCLNQNGVCKPNSGVF